MKVIIISKEDRQARSMADDLNRRLSIYGVKSEITENPYSVKHADLAIVLGGDGTICKQPGLALKELPLKFFQAISAV